MRYSHQAMIDLILENPNMKQGEIAATFGYTEGWISNILASEAFQAAMAARRNEIIDPELRATIKERFEALVIQSTKVLMAKLSQPVVSDQVALRCAELGAKALGIGGHAAPVAPKETSAERLSRLAGRLRTLQPGKEIIDVEAIREVEDAGRPAVPGADRQLQGPGPGGR